MCCLNVHVNSDLSGISNGKDNISHHRRYQTKVKLGMNDGIAVLYQFFFPHIMEVIEEVDEIGHSIQHRTYLFLTRSLLKLK